MHTNKLAIPQRGVHMPALTMRKLAPFADEARAREVDVIHRNIGQPDIETPPEFWEAVSKFPEQTLAYGPSVGRRDIVYERLNQVEDVYCPKNATCLLAHF